MEKTFHPQQFIQDLGEDLITEFDRANRATHGGAIGSMRERSIKDKLNIILPGTVGIDSGFVIDSFGHTSKQCDIILYEKDYSSKLTINNDISNSYFFCENVIAVGEIKSTLTKKEFIDACDKLRIIKELKRFHPINKESYRPYFMPIELPAKYGFNQAINPYHQIYTFILCKKSNISFTSIIDLVKENFVTPNLYFNMFISLKDGILLYYNRNEKKTKPSAIDATDFYIQNDDNNFNKFLADLIHFIEFGGTTYCPKARYFIKHKPQKEGDLKMFPI